MCVGALSCRIYRHFIALEGQTWMNCFFSFSWHSISIILECCRMAPKHKNLDNSYKGIEKITYMPLLTLVNRLAIHGRRRCFVSQILYLIVTHANSRNIVKLASITSHNIRKKVTVLFRNHFQFKCICEAISLSPSSVRC